MEHVNWEFSKAEKAFLQKIVEAREKRIEYILREKVTPPIKGDITKGKVRWRGIVLASTPEGHEVVLQRGKSVGIVSEPATVIIKTSPRGISVQTSCLIK